MEIYINCIASPKGQEIVSNRPSQFYNMMNSVAFCREVSLILGRPAASDLCFLLIHERCTAEESLIKR